MASHQISTDPGSDITACDREPIHLAGAIQPHGMLLIADVHTHRVVAGAGALETLLTPDWLGRTLSVLLDQDIAARLEPVIAGPGATVPALPIRGRDGEWYDVSLHRSGDRLIAELERGDDAPMSASAVLTLLEGFAIGFERAGNLEALCTRAAVTFRMLTGFDRVMVYRFLDDDAGRVVAEDRDPDLPAFMNHHFPASDIPRQARALYVRNRSRAIPDVGYEAQPIRPADFADTDLSDVALRSVSPIHVQYLRNMGVQASASISIVKGGLLWGLIACHHREPRLLPAGVRAAATVLAGSLSRQIRAKEEAETYRERLRLRGLEDAIAPQLAAAANLLESVAHTRQELCEMLGADGFAFVYPGGIDQVGRCPAPDRIAAIADWVRARSVAEPFATHQLGAVYPPAQDCAGVASGLLGLALANEAATLLWFRAEQPEEIEWAGNPHKAVALAPGEALTPRASFETWSQSVRGRARRWTLEEVESAHRLRRAFREAAQTRQLRDLNAELRTTLTEKDQLLQQKDLLMKEVDHRIQNSLQLVAAFLSMQARAVGPGPVAEQLGEAQARLAAVAQVHRRLYRDDQIETIDLSRYLGELTADMKNSLGVDWAERMTVDLAPVLIPTDRAVNVGLIMTELVINATKYAYGGAAGPIAIVLEQHRNRLRLSVADEGGGKALGGGSGFGSRMMTAMVARLDGELMQEDNLPGLRAVLDAPIEGLPR